MFMPFYKFKDRQIRYSLVTNAGIVFVCDKAKLFVFACESCLEVSTGMYKSHLCVSIYFEDRSGQPLKWEENGQMCKNLTSSDFNNSFLYLSRSSLCIVWK